MLERRAHLLYALAGLLLTIGLTIALDADAAFSRSTGAWFETLILIVVAAFLLEPQFSSGASATTNAIAALLVAVGSHHDRHAPWWVALSVVAVVTLVLTFTSYVLRDPRAAESSRQNRVARVLGQIAAVLGGWRSILLGTLALCLATFNPPFGDEWQVAVVTVLYSLLISRLQPHRLFGILLGQPTEPGAAGAVGAVFPPFEAVVVGGDSIVLGSLLRLSSSRGVAEALVTTEVTHQGARAWRVFAPDLMSALPDVATEPSSLVSVQLASSDAEGFAALRDELTAPGIRLLGALSEGTSMRAATIELVPGDRVELGDVVWTRDDTGRTFWQIADATLTRTSWSGDTRRSIHAQAAQVGRWDDRAAVFRPDIRSPNSAGVVFGGVVSAPTIAEIPRNRLRIGSLPKSLFPVIIDLVQLSRTHAAILGTTGTGKTHLAFALLHALRRLGVKIVCLDLTGQYAVRFPEALGVANANDVLAFLESEHELAICTPAHGTAISVANAVSRKSYEWASAQPTLDAGAAARCVLVFEEAQNFVPESFVINDWELKAKAQDTSLVVMEGRKFGLGFLLVSQRTAMITKSALSQCNTVFAFQAVDQTGLDYLEGLCGPALIKGIPTLPHRTAVVMGSALRSAAPLIAYMDGADVIVP